MSFKKLKLLLLLLLLSFLIAPCTLDQYKPDKCLKIIAKFPRFNSQAGKININKPIDEGDEYVPVFVDKLEAIITDESGAESICETLIDRDNPVNEINCDEIASSPSYQIVINAYNFNENNDPENQWIKTHEISGDLLYSDFISGEGELIVTPEVISGVSIDDKNDIDNDQIHFIPNAQDFSLGVTPEGDFVFSIIYPNNKRILLVDYKGELIQSFVGSEIYRSIYAFPAIRYIEGAFFVISDFKINLEATPPASNIYPEILIYDITENTVSNQLSDPIGENFTQNDNFSHLDMDIDFGNIAIAYSKAEGADQWGEINLKVYDSSTFDEKQITPVISQSPIHSYPQILPVSDYQAYILALENSTPDVIKATSCSITIEGSHEPCIPLDLGSMQVSIDLGSPNVVGPFSIAKTSGENYLIAYGDDKTVDTKRDIYVHQIGGTKLSPINPGEIVSFVEEPDDLASQAQSNPLIFKYRGNNYGLLWKEFSGSVASSIKYSFINNNGTATSETETVISSYNFTKLNDHQIAISDDGLAMIAWLDEVNNRIYYKRYIF